jgi:hypothetical protein
METPTEHDAGQEPELSQAPSLPREPPLAEDSVDEVVAQSFPASDPPQWWAGRPG